MKRVYKICLGFLALSSLELVAQGDCIETIVSESIISITDDQDYIWCGTEEAGLLRIDKETEEKTYWDMSNTDMKSNRIKSVVLYNDKLYLSSDSTVLLLQDEEIQVVHEDIEGLLIEDVSGDLLIAGRRDFYKMNTDEELTYHQVLTEVVFDQCCSQNTDIAIDEDHNVWISHWDFYEFDIMKFDGNEWSVYDITNSDLPIESPGPNQITTDGNHVYASNYAGVYLFADNEWTNITNSVDNGQDNVEGLVTMSVEFDSDNVLWLAADNPLVEETKKIAFQVAGQWYFVTNDDNGFAKINLFQESLDDASILYAGNKEGLIILDKTCLLPGVGIEELTDEDKVSVYPIPSSNIVHIASDMNIDRVELFDLTGNLVLEQNNVLQDIHVKQYKPGVYLLKMYIKDKVVTKRVLKK